MTEYLQNVRYESRVVGPDGDDEWGIPPDGTRPEGTIAMRTVATPYRIAFVGPPEVAAEQYVVVPDDVVAFA